MTEPQIEKSVFSPGQALWTIDIDGTMQMWTVDGTGRPTLTLGDPPFPAPKGKPWMKSQTTKMAEIFALIFGISALALTLFGIFTDASGLRSYAAWAAPVMLGLVGLVGYCRWRDKRRCLRQ